MTRICSFACLAFIATAAHAGPFTEPGIPGRIVDPGDPASTIVNPELRAWAGGVEEYNPAPGINATNGDAAQALGPIGTSSFMRTVSLGDLDAAQIAAGGLPGSIVLSFAQPLGNGPGWDLAVFENGFFFFPPNSDKLFAELAYVEVSSDNLHYARFPSRSLTTEATIFVPDFGSGPLRNFAGIDPTDVDKLAGKDPALVGTPFDFSTLASAAFVVSGEVDLNAIRYVRIIDIPGNGSFVDTTGHGILDTWVTTDLEFGDGGFDLDAVAARYPVPEPSTWMLAMFATLITLVHRQRLGTSKTGV